LLDRVDGKFGTQQGALGSPEKVFYTAIFTLPYHPRFWVHIPNCQCSTTPHKDVTRRQRSNNICSICSAN